MDNSTEIPSPFCHSNGQDKNTIDILKNMCLVIHSGNYKRELKKELSDRKILFSAWEWEQFE
jgi:hypothetical protein